MSTAAVVVTFNRKQLLLECLDALLRQTKPIDRIYVIDNASTDGTAVLLQEQGFFDRIEISYVYLDSNTGSSGGFYQGIKSAFEGAYDWIWVMDDDAEPIDTAHAELANYFDSEARSLAPLVINRDGTPSLTHRGAARAHLSEQFVECIAPTDLKKPVHEIDFCSFVGLAVHRSVVEAIGFPKREMFLHFDDNEYSARIRKISKMYLVPASKIIHKEFSRSTVEIRSVLGRKSHRIRFNAFWIRYYGIRNGAWLMHQRFGIRGAAFALFTEVRKIPGMVLYDDHKWRRIRFVMNACMDGLRGRFDNAKPKKILGL